jgi:hypothetical protein
MIEECIDSKMSSPMEGWLSVDWRSNIVFSYFFLVILEGCHEAKMKPIVLHQTCFSYKFYFFFFFVFKVTEYRPYQRHQSSLRAFSPTQ